VLPALTHGDAWPSRALRQWGAEEQGVYRALVSGVSTRPPILQTSDPQATFAQYKSLAIQTSAAEGVAVPEGSQDRIKNLIAAEVGYRSCPGRFANVCTEPAQSGDLLLLVRFTSYEEGNSFARFMMAGLGGMKIHADVAVKDGGSGDIICKGECGKTFHWVASPE
jgi:Domain of unknown function (DUF4410)